MVYFVLIGNILAAVLLMTCAYFLVRSIAAGAPFVPTMNRHLGPLVRMADLQPDDVVYELGCGDGRFCIAAAGAGVAKVVGIDISRPLVWLAKRRIELAGVGDRVRIERRDILHADVSGATVVFMYLMPGINDSLAAGTLRTLQPGARILSSSFPIDTEKHPMFRLIRSERFGAIRGYLYQRT